MSNKIFKDTTEELLTKRNTVFTEYSKKKTKYEQEYLDLMPKAVNNEVPYSALIALTTLFYEEAHDMLKEIISLDDELLRRFNKEG